MAKLTRRWTSSPVLSILTASFAGVVKLVWPSLGICLAISAACLALGAVTLGYVERRARAAATLALA